MRCPQCSSEGCQPNFATPSIRGRVWLKCPACSHAFPDPQGSFQEEPRPHPVGCACCRTARRCNVCGVFLRPGERCSNGRCARCHSSVCTPGGATGPGHGSGLKLCSQGHYYVKDHVECPICKEVMTG